ncbi:DHDD domain-containing protein [Naegleria gruberi]|uniref:DHDD domain-containing protein n=1 Tax=Naegleria gruberi TaxID=5762 RepID=D2V9R6_NAEGR|nr:DHDD domain-containing protein [Naegleria gruberi]EFC46515.1 DHDD domain-containing protein [Naegleria gruberi]|eukprot:XP_002679259.1 DHDD domain-containing protein [Naegleria gruberi strain NEG-M]
MWKGWNDLVGTVTGGNHHTSTENSEESEASNEATNNSSSVPSSEYYTKDDFELINNKEDAEIHLVILIAGMGARKGHYLSDSLLVPFGKWFDINKCQQAMKEEVSNCFKSYANDQVKKRSPHILIRSIDYCSTVREEGGYNEKLNLISMKSGVQFLRLIANESMIDVLMYNSEKIKQQMQTTAVKQINEIFEEFKDVPIKSVSFVGHSLGSVLAFDILYQHQESGNTLLKMNPNRCFLVGSPLGLFLTMSVQTTNQYLEAFHCVNPQTNKKQLLKEIDVYHLYHPYDPVAYRLDPHLDSRFGKHDPHSLEYFARRFNPNHYVNQFNNYKAKIFGNQEKIDEELSELLKQYEIIDYCLPVNSELVINEYLSAGDVHLKYWNNTEVICFILEKMNLISANKSE